MIYTLPSLPYAYDALEPYIDAKTMEIHHAKHHQAYIDKLNAVLERYPQYSDSSLSTLLCTLASLDMPEQDKLQLKNHGGGHLNHSFFWSIMGKPLDPSLTQRLISTFGSIESFKDMFEKIAIGHFGSGWAWLADNEKKELVLYSLPNQDSPYLRGHTPIIGLDVWEHAYYLSYQNRRAEYVKNWWNTIKLV